MNHSQNLYELKTSIDFLNETNQELVKAIHQLIETLNQKMEVEVVEQVVNDLADAEIETVSETLSLDDLPVDDMPGGSALFPKHDITLTQPPKPTLVPKRKPESSSRRKNLKSTGLQEFE